MMSEPDTQTSSTRPRRQRTLKGLSFNRILPNILTLLALCAGMTAIKLGFQDRWQAAAAAIAAAAVLDALDGRVARLLNGSSKFGAELDSLSDVISFGVAPAIMMYFWALQSAGRFAWILSLLFAACCAMRLARFNTLLDDPDAPAWKANFFSGVPAPAGAGLVLLPMVVSFQIGDGIARSTEVASATMIIVSTLLVSRVPTLSFKRLKVSRDFFMPTMILLVLLVAGTFTVPWFSLTAILVLYLLSFPFSLQKHAKLDREWKKQQGTSTTEPPAD
jgi:CDP-diacylglycerol--serine O-phosphatidyltransferase